MKNLLLLAAFALCVASCNAPSEQSPSPATPTDDYFYPPTNGLQYIYAQDSAALPAAVDTSTYQVVVGSTYNSYAKLVQQNVSSASTNVLYYYRVDANQTGVKCILSATGSDQGIVALEGNLSVGSSWQADSSGNIQASVVGRYSEYFLPGRQQLYYDVVAVQYVDDRQSSGNYTVRMFAKDYGLIYQENVTPSTAASSSIQLLDRIASPNTAGIPSRDHWYDARGRYIVAMDPNWLDQQ